MNVALANVRAIAESMFLNWRTTASAASFLQTILDLLCRELGKRHDDLPLDQADVTLQPFDVSPEQLTECAPRTQVADCGRTELENKLKGDAVGQLRYAAVFDRPGDIPAQGRLRVS